MGWYFSSARFFRIPAKSSSSPELFLCCDDAVLELCVEPLCGLGVGDGDGVRVEFDDPLFALCFLGVVAELPLVELGGDMQADFSFSTTLKYNIKS